MYSHFLILNFGMVGEGGGEEFNAETKLDDINKVK